MCGVDESGAAPHLIIASGLDGCDDMLHGGSSASRTLLVLDHALWLQRVRDTEKGKERRAGRGHREVD